MLVNLRQIGSSTGVIIPKPFIVQLGLEETIELELSGNALTLRKPSNPVRVGWAEASKQIAAAGENELVMGEFANDADADLTW
ncbi:MAG: mazE [Variovorax sp.]|nr:mazE [Variovorax sp.]